MWEEYIHLLTDPAHLMFEATLIILIDGLLLGLAIPFIKKAVRKHDKTHHGDDMRKYNPVIQQMHDDEIDFGMPTWFKGWFIFCALFAIGSLAAIIALIVWVVNQFT